jgi:feruloyl esterase
MPPGSSSNRSHGRFSELKKSSTICPSSENAAATDQFRYFVLPGVSHCAGGPGADRVDYLAAMDEWVRSGNAPEQLIGTRRDGSLTRPHCAWPDVARFEGEGDPNDPDNWACVPRR